MAENDEDDGGNTGKFKDFKRQVRERLKLADTLYVIDIINACSLRCPSCPISSVGIGRGGKKMSFDLWTRILDKAQRESKIDHIQMYSFSDACLHPDLHLFIEEATRRGIRTYLSTMLQKTNCDFAKVIEARPAEFRVSFPGWDKMTYYQAGANVQRFTETLEKVSKLPRHPETLWSVVFHLYRDNIGEFQAVKELAKRHKMKLVAIPAIFMVPEKIVSKDYSEADKLLISRLLETPEKCISGMKKKDETWCKDWEQITLDAEGNVYLCQLVYEERFKLMNFLEHPLPEIRKAIRSHSFCGDCMKHGVHAYNELYADFTVSDDPIGDMDRLHDKDRIIPH